MNRTTMIDVGLLEKIKAIYNAPGRYYHNFDHISNMLREFKFSWFSESLNDEQYRRIMISVLYHDIANTEEESVKMLLESNLNESDSFKQSVANLIMSTKSPELIDDTYQCMLNYLDLGILRKPLKEMIQDHYNVFKEYRNNVIWQDFKSERIKIFKTRVWGIIERITQEQVFSSRKPAMSMQYKTCVEALNSIRPKIGLYIGSFNPFHIGHQNIVEKALSTFDQVIIIRASKVDHEQVDVKCAPCMTVNYEPITNIINNIIKDDADYTLIRGIRNGYDLIDESNYLATIKSMGVTLPIVHIISDPEFQHVSSTMVRELKELKDPTYIHYINKETNS